MTRNIGNVQALQSLAVKIGLGEDKKLISKAAEFERRLQMKSTTSYNISDTGKVVICLDLAATALGVEFDNKTLIKYSGLKPLLYKNSKKILENILELNGDRLTVSLLCAQVHCDGVDELAQRILQQYQQTTKMEIDLNLPQYVCMAVHQACRVNKVKVAKSKLIEKSRLKPGQWSKMEAEWTKMVDLHFTVVRKKKGRPATKVLDEEEPIDKMEIDEPTKKDHDDEPEPQVEPYEDWKRRILAAAYAALKRENDKQVIPENDKRTQVNDVKHVNDRQNPVNDAKHVNDKDRKADRNNSKLKTDDRKQLNDVDKQITEVNGLRDQMASKHNDDKLKKDIKIIETPIRIKLNKNNFVDVQMNDVLVGKTDQQILKLNKEVVKASNHVNKKDRLVANDKYDHKKALILDDDLFCLSPRRSPRKTPQKYEPYKSPSKTKGVRLLFPSE